MQWGVSRDAHLACANGLGEVGAARGALAAVVARVRFARLRRLEPALVAGEAADAVAGRLRDREALRGADAAVLARVRGAGAAGLELAVVAGVAAGALEGGRAAETSAEIARDSQR